MLTIGGVDRSTRLKAFDASPSGPGVIGSATLSLEASGGGGISILNRMEVKLWLPFNDAGAGVADRGRVFGGLVEDRAEGTIGTTKTWDLTLSDWNLLGDTVVRDLTSSVPLSAGTFATQMTTLVELVQENGWGVVAQTINTTLFVADLHATMPAVTLPGGKKLGWYIQALCLKAQELNTALRPQWYIGWDTSFGATELFGGPVLWVYDGALTPAPAFAFSDAPTGAEKKMFNAVTRGLDSTQMVQRRQSIFNTGAIATYSDTTAQTTYPNWYINHNRVGNSGYWGLEPVEDRESRTFAEAEAKLRGHVLSHSTPRETIEFETPERVKPGEVVTITWPLYSLSAASKRVAGVGTHYEPPDTLWSRVILNRRRSGLFAGEEGIEAPPEEGLPPRPLPITNLDVPINVYDEARREAHLVITFTPSVTGTVARHVALITVGARSWEEATALPGTAEIHAYGPGGEAYDVTVVAEDHWNQRSLEFTPHETGTTADLVVWASPPNPGAEELEPVDAPSPQPRHWTPVLTGSGAVSSATDQHLGGARAFKATVSNTSDKAMYLSEYVVNEEGMTHWISVPARGSATRDALTIIMLHYDGASLLRTDTLVADRTVTTSWDTQVWYNTPTPAPAGADRYQLQVGIDGASAACSLWWDDIVVMPVLPGPSIADGAIDGGHLASTIDYTGVFTTIAAAEAGALTARITDTGTASSPYVLRQQHRLSSGTPGVGMGAAHVFQADSTTTQDRMQARIASSWLTATDGTRRAKLSLGTNIQGSESTLERLGLTDTEVKTNGQSLVVGGAALATNATFGFLYLPTSAGKPTGSPVSQTGTAPTIYDSSGNVLFIHNGTRWLGPLTLWSLADSFSGGTALTYTGTTLIGRWAAPSMHNWWIVGITWSFRVSTTNDGSNYWTLRMGTENAGGGGAAQNDVTTADKSPDVNYAKAGTSFTNNPMDFASTDFFDVFLEVRKDTGAPGTLNLYGANLLLMRA